MIGVSYRIDGSRPSAEEKAEEFIHRCMALEASALVIESGRIAVVREKSGEMGLAERPRFRKLVLSLTPVLRSYTQFAYT